MLVGAHVSPAGGPANAVANGEERGCESIQFFSQSPRMWKGREYSDEEVAAYKDAFAASKKIKAATIHALYLINCASEDTEIRKKSLAALTLSLRNGAALGVDGVVVHVGSALKTSVDKAITRASKVLTEALAESEGCTLHLENTAGSGATLGRSFEELAALIEQTGHDERLRVCLDSCHLYASGYDVRTRESLTQVIDDFDRIVGCDRLASLHVNDSKTGLGSNVDRHAPLGTGELGKKGLAVFISEPRFDGLAGIFEGPGFEGKGIVKADIDEMRKLRSNGVRARKR